MLGMGTYSFKETFKLESDMLITSNIDHWWYGARLKNICFTTKVCNYQRTSSR